MGGIATGSVGLGLGLGSYWCAIIAFALNTGAYTSEILRSAFQTIKPGIIEAGKSLGLI